MASQAMVYDVSKRPNDIGNPPDWFANQEFKVSAHFFAHEDVGPGNADNSVVVYIPFGTSAQRATDLIRDAVAAQAASDLGVAVAVEDVQFCEFLSTIATGA